MRPPKFNPRQIGKFVVLSVVGLVIVYVVVMLLVAKPVAPAGETKAIADEKNISADDLTVREEAARVYAEAKASGLDLTTGPCLLESTEMGWAFDIAHLPREPIDDLPENQCLSYLTGKIKHLVELDNHGAVIRLK